MHCFYVGRNWRAIIITACWWVFAIGYTILIKLEEQQGMLGQALGIIGAIGIVMSAWDLSKILFGSFRVPVRMGEMSHASKPKYT